MTQITSFISNHDGFICIGYEVPVPVANKSKPIDDVKISIYFLVTNNKDVYPRYTEFLKIISQLYELTELQ